MPEPPEIILGVPGLWPDHSDLVQSIVRDSEGYLFAGRIMMRMGSKDAIEVDLCDHDPNLSRAFDIASGRKLPADVLARIGNHTRTMYLIAKGGSFENARKAMEAARGVLRAGGIAVKVESSGIAHSSEAWHQLCDDSRDFAVYKALVTLIGASGSYYSCGMHNIGFRDAIVEADIPPQEAAELLDGFLRYSAFENPTLNDGETFSLDAESPYYRIAKQSCEHFESEHSFHNPYGMWRLVPAWK